MKKILAAFKKFFTWPYSVHVLILALGLVEYFAGFHLFGGATLILGVWGFLISFNAPKP